MSLPEQHQEGGLPRQAVAELVVRPLSGPPSSGRWLPNSSRVALLSCSPQQPPPRQSWDGKTLPQATPADGGHVASQKWPFACRFSALVVSASTSATPSQRAPAAPPRNVTAQNSVCAWHACYAFLQVPRAQQRCHARRAHMCRWCAPAYSPRQRQLTSFFMLCKPAALATALLARQVLDQVRDWPPIQQPSPARTTNALSSTPAGVSELPLSEKHRGPQSWTL